jgi:formylmethanofuran dehydrogenase subunit A
MTRAAPARLLGLRDRGHLGAGAAADVAVYREAGDVEAMFTRAAWLFKDGAPVVREGRVVATPVGGTHFAQPVFDAGVERALDDRPLGVHKRYAVIGHDELCSCCNGGRLLPSACEARSVLCTSTASRSTTPLRRPSR